MAIADPYPAEMLPSPAVLATHPDFLIAYKPAGMSFHSEDDEPGFFAQMRALTGEEDLHAVHRLDRITSGLVLLARHGKAAAELGHLFETGLIEKYYLALSDRKPLKKQGWVKGAMEKGRGGAWRLARDGDLLAVTQFFSFGLGDGTRLFVVRPRTGRTHQIRVALKSLGSPILGDERYGGTSADRGYLHAYALRFEWRDEIIEFIQASYEGERFVDEAMAAQLTAVGEPWGLAWPAWKTPAETTRRS